jgi:hypothetical protein
VTPTFHALWMLCALGALVFAAAVSSVRTAVAFGLGFALAALFTSGSALPNAVWVGGVTAVAAAAYLFKPRWRPAVFLLGGALAGWWATLLEVQALPFFVALPIVGGVVILTMRLSRSRPSFAPDVLTDEGVLAIMVLGLVVAVMPGVMDGWHAATNLSGGQERAGDPVAIPMWTLVVILASTTLGGVYSMWSRR